MFRLNAAGNTMVLRKVRVESFGGGQGIGLRGRENQTNGCEIGGHSACSLHKITYPITSQWLHDIVQSIV